MTEKEHRMTSTCLKFLQIIICVCKCLYQYGNYSNLLYVFVNVYINMAYTIKTDASSTE